jgi:hypothetical protein
VNSKARILSLSCVLALCAVPGCDDPDLELDETNLEFRDVSDPALSATYTACVDAGEFNGRDVVIRYPMGHNCLSTLADSPIVLVLPGAGYSYTTYPYLLDHLAQNGFIAVSAAVLADETPSAHNGHTAAATTAIGILDDMRTSWAFGSEIDPSHLSIVAHSRGGMTAAYIANQLEGNGDPWTVRAIVKLAGKANGSYPIDGNASKGLLVLQGAVDTDQEAQVGFDNYDNSGTEGAPDGLHRAMKLFEFGDHPGFSTRDGLTDQAHVTKGYVLAFLAAHVLGDWTWYEDYIRGDDVPWGWGGRIAGQFSEGLTRIVIDNFEDNQFSIATIPFGAVSKTLLATASVSDLAADFEIQGETHALQASGSVSGDYVQWTFPAVNVGLYRSLSLRMGQVDGAASSSVSVQIRNAGVWQPSVLLSTYGTIEPPMTMCQKGDPACTPADFELEAHMGTIRVPLSALGSLNAVDGVRLVFTIKSTGRTYVVDSLEFAGSVFMP